MVRCFVYIVHPSVLSCTSNLKLHQTIEGTNIFKQENVMLQLMFNLGLTLTNFWTNGPEVHCSVLPKMNHKHTHPSEVPVCQTEFSLLDTRSLSGNRWEKKNLNLYINCQWCLTRISSPEESHNLHVYM